MGSLYLWAFGFALINPFISKKTYKYYLWAILAVLVYFTYHIEVTEGMDLYRNLGEIQLYREMGWNWVYSNRLDDNPLTIIMFYIFAQFEDPMLYPAFISLVCYGLAFSILLKCSKRYDLTKGQMNCLLLLFCLCFYFDQAISNNRIYLCYAIISYFMYCEIIDGKFKKISWIAYIACCFIHYAATPFLLFRFLLAINNRLKGSDLLLLTVVAVIFICADFFASKLGALGGFLGTLASKNEGYQTYQVFGIWQFLSSLMRLIGFTWLYAYVYKECSPEEQSLVFYLACVNIMLIIMLGEYQLVLRTPNFIHYLAMVPVSRFLKLEPTINRKGNLIRSGIVMYLLITTVFTIFYQLMWTHPYIGFEF